jgi:8-oxo-dGTP pyrophosphatase MutT (NUDIX family)
MGEVALPGKASTIVVARAAAADRFEVLMTRRPAHLKTLGGFFVFPGGSVQEDDCSEKIVARCRGLTPTEARNILGATMTPGEAMGHWVAAVRELFEETGIYIFSGKDLRPAASDGLKERLSQKRQSLWQGSLGLAALLESEQLFCDVGRLSYLFHRITPDHYPVRLTPDFMWLPCRRDKRPWSFQRKSPKASGLSPKKHWKSPRRAV